MGRFVTALAIPPTITVTDTNKVMPGISSMLAAVMPAVVNVTVMGETRGTFLTNNRQPKSPSPNAVPYTKQFTEIGSGVIVDAGKGYIVTNAHVVLDAKVVTITLSDGISMF